MPRHALLLACNLHLAIEQVPSKVESVSAQAEPQAPVLIAEEAAVAKDGTKAVRWYQLAAAQGHPQAAFNLGTYLRHMQARAGCVRCAELRCALVPVQRAAMHMAVE